MIGALFGRRRPSPHAATVKAWAAARFSLGDDDVVSVTEIACREAGCPDVETVLTMMRAGRPGFTRKIEKPLAAVTEADVAALDPGEG